MSDLRELYQELIVDHGRHPRHFKKLPNANCVQEGYNPLCGDRLTLYLSIENDRVIDVSFEGAGCAVSIASASLMTEALKNKTLSEVQLLFDAFHTLVTTGTDASQETLLGKLSVLAGVREFPMRVKCATLAWHTAIAAIRHDTHPVSTE